MTSLHVLQLLYVGLTCTLIVADVAIIRAGRNLSACQRRGRQANARLRLVKPSNDDEEAVEDLNESHEEEKSARFSAWFWKAAMILFAIAWIKMVAFPALAGLPKSLASMTDKMFLAFVVCAPITLALSIFVWAFPSERTPKPRDTPKAAGVDHRKKL